MSREAKETCAPRKAERAAFAGKKKEAYDQNELLEGQKHA
jgi:hypothetical protein